MRYRVIVLPVVGALLVVGGFLFSNLNDNLVYYVTPTEAVSKKPQFEDGTRFRLGGWVEKGSVERTADGARFVATDGDTRVPVVHTGAPSQLFQAGIGVVVEGAWEGDSFYSDTMLVKHDENYAPPTDDPTTDEPATDGGGRAADERATEGEQP